MDNQICFYVNNTHLIAELKGFLQDKFDFIYDFSKVVELEPGEHDGVLEFIYDTDPYDQFVKITIDKNGNALKLESNDPDVMITVYQELCNLDWGWIEV